MLLSQGNLQSPLQHYREQINQVMGGILGGDVSIHTIDEWRAMYDQVPLVEKTLNETFGGEVFENPRDRKSAFSATLRLLYHLIVNKEIRTQFNEAMRLRKTLDLQEGAEQEHVGYLTFTGMKT